MAQAYSYEQLLDALLFYRSKFREFPRSGNRSGWSPYTVEFIQKSRLDLATYATYARRFGTVGKLYSELEQEFFAVPSAPVVAVKPLVKLRDRNKRTPLKLFSKA
jgi:hypothetical protein